MKKFFIILIILALLTGCQQTIQIANNNISIESDLNTNQAYQEEWQELAKGVSFREIPIRVENSANSADVMTVFKFQPDNFTFSLNQQISEPLTIAAWQKKYLPLFVCNGGYFLEDNQPAELLKIKGEKFGTNLTADSVGEFIINDNGQPDIVLDAQQNDADNILQSYPLLVRPDGALSVKDDSGQAAPRTVVAKDADGNILFIFTEKYYFSLYQLQNYLIASNLNIKIALNLDGGPSSGYAFNTQEKKISDTAAVPNVVMIFAK